MSKEAINKDELKEKLVSALGKEEAEKLMGEAEANEKANESTEVKVNLTEEHGEIIKEAAAKAIEEYKKANKKFAFNSSDENKAKVGKAQKELDAAKYFQFLYEGDVKSAVEIDSIQRQAMRYGEKALDTTSGFALIPEIFEDNIFSAFGDYSVIMRDANVDFTSKPGNTINYNELDTKVTVYLKTENGSITGSTPSYSNPDLLFDEYGAEVVLTDVFLEDNEATSLMSNLSAQISEQLDKTLQTRFLTSSVSNKEGITNWAGTTTVTSVVSYTDTNIGHLQSLETQQLASDIYLSEFDRSKFYMHANTYDSIWTNTVTAGTAYTNYDVNPYQGRERQFLGHDVEIVNQLATPTSAATNYIVYGDLSKHLIVRFKRNMRMRVNTTGNTFDGRNLNVAGGRQLVMDMRIGHCIVLPDGLYLLRGTTT